MLTLNVIKSEDLATNRSVIYSSSPQSTKCRIHRYTLPIFLDRAISIHGNKFDYSQVTADHIRGNKSKIPVICNICKYQWSPTILNHISNKRGCPSCAGLVPWTLDLFLLRAVETHGNIYDYSQVTSSHITGKDSKIPIICHTCNHKWSPSIHAHINGRTGCPNCAKVIPWTLERFLMVATRIHGRKYDYSCITELHIQGKDSILSIRCNSCNYEWNPTLHAHINGKYGCPNCARKAPWTLKNVLSRANEVHGTKFDYSQIKESHIKGDQSKIPVICNECHNLWAPSINNHIGKGSGCPHCAMIRGYSQIQLDWIESIMLSEGVNIQYALSPEGEYKIPGIGKVDGYCVETNTIYEYHGNFWHGNPIKFNPDDINPINGKTYGELYARTTERDQKIRNLGYNLIVKWENE